MQRDAETQLERAIGRKRESEIKRKKNRALFLFTGVNITGFCMSTACIQGNPQLEIDSHLISC